MTSKSKKKTHQRPQRSSDRSRRRKNARAARIDVQQARTAATKQRFLDQFKILGTVSGTAKAVGIDRSTHYEWLDLDPIYAKDFESAKVVAVELLETEMRRRAMVGWEEPVFQGGEKVGTVRKFSDTLLIFALKGARPEKYRERFEHVGAEGGPIETRVVFGGRYKAGGQTA